MIFMTSLFLYLLNKDSCSTQCTKTVLPKYYLMEKCHRSKLGISSRAYYTSLTSCQRLAIEKQALALNFSPPDANITESSEYTCEVLTCAESDGGLSLSNDTRYDYYSIYANPFPKINSTCVPSTGMFHLTQSKLNYTEAVEECRKQSGVLADVGSEQKTDALAQMLMGSKVQSALTGLRKRNSVFFSTDGNSLDCTTYKAWAPGHPKRHKNETCVIITRQRTWKTTNCNQRFQALCELIPGGPYRIGSIFLSRRKNDTAEQFNSSTA